MGKGGPKPAHHVKLEDILSGSWASLDEEEYEVTSRGSLQLSWQDMNGSLQAQEVSSAHRNNTSDMKEETTEDGDSPIHTYDVECFTLPKQVDQRISPHPLGISGECKGNWNMNAHESGIGGSYQKKTSKAHGNVTVHHDKVNWNTNAHGSVIEGSQTPDPEPEDENNSIKSDLDSRPKESCINVDTSNDEMNKEKELSPKSTSTLEKLPSGGLNRKVNEKVLKTEENKEEAMHIRKRTQTKDGINVERNLEGNEERQSIDKCEMSTVLSSTVDNQVVESSTKGIDSLSTEMISQSNIGPALCTDELNCTDGVGKLKPVETEAMGNVELIDDNMQMKGSISNINMQVQPKVEGMETSEEANKANPTCEAEGLCLAGAPDCAVEDQPRTSSSNEVSLADDNEILFSEVERCASCGNQPLREAQASSVIHDKCSVSAKNAREEIITESNSCTIKSFQEEATLRDITFSLRSNENVPQCRNRVSPYVESGNSNSQMFNCSPVYDFNRVLEKLNAAISLEKPQPVHLTHVSSKDSVSCEEMVRNSELEEDHLHSTVCPSNKLEEFTTEAVPTNLISYDVEECSSTVERKQELNLPISPTNDKTQSLNTKNTERGIHPSQSDISKRDENTEEHMQMNIDVYPLCGIIRKEMESTCIDRKFNVDLPASQGDTGYDPSSFTDMTISEKNRDDDMQMTLSISGPQEGNVCSGGNTGDVLVSKAVVDVSHSDSAIDVKDKERTLNLSCSDTTKDKKTIMGTSTEPATHSMEREVLNATKLPGTGGFDNSLSQDDPGNGEEKTNDAQVRELIPSESDTYNDEDANQILLPKHSSYQLTENCINMSEASNGNTPVPDLLHEGVVCNTQQRIQEEPKELDSSLPEEDNEIHGGENTPLGGDLKADSTPKNVGNKQYYPRYIDLCQPQEGNVENVKCISENVDYCEPQEEDIEKIENATKNLDICQTFEDTATKIQNNTKNVDLWDSSDKTRFESESIDPCRHFKEEGEKIEHATEKVVLPQPLGDSTNIEYAFENGDLCEPKEEDTMKIEHLLINHDGAEPNEKGAEIFGIYQPKEEGTENIESQPEYFGLCHLKREDVEIVGLCQSKEEDVEIVGLCQSKEEDVEIVGLCQSKEEDVEIVGLCQSKEEDVEIVGLCQSKKEDVEIVGLCQSKEEDVEIVGLCQSKEEDVEIVGLCQSKEEDIEIVGLCQFKEEDVEIVGLCQSKEEDVEIVGLCQSKEEDVEIVGLCQSKEEDVEIVGLCQSKEEDVEIVGLCQSKEEDVEIVGLCQSKEEDVEIVGLCQSKEEDAENIENPSENVGICQPNEEDGVKIEQPPVYHDVGESEEGTENVGIYQPKEEDVETIEAQTEFIRLCQPKEEDAEHTENPSEIVFLCQSKEEDAENMENQPKYVGVCQSKKEDAENMETQPEYVDVCQPKGEDVVIVGLCQSKEDDAANKENPSKNIDLYQSKEEDAENKENPFKSIGLYQSKEEDAEEMEYSPESVDFCHPFEDSDRIRDEILESTDLNDLTDLKIDLCQSHIDNAVYIGENIVTNPEICRCLPENMTGKEETEKNSGHYFCCDISSSNEKANGDFQFNQECDGTGKQRLKPHGDLTKMDESGLLFSEIDNKTPDVCNNGDGPLALKESAIATDSSSSLSVESGQQSSRHEDLSASSHHRPNIEVLVRPVLSEKEFSHGQEGYHPTNMNLKTSPRKDVANLDSSKGSLEVKYVERRGKGFPVFVMIDMKSKQQESGRLVTQNEPTLHTNTTFDKTVPTLDSVPSSLASVNSADSTCKKNAIKSSQKTASDSTSRPRQKVTFQIVAPEGAGDALLNAEKSPECSEHPEKLSHVHQDSRVLDTKEALQKPMVASEKLDEKNPSLKETVTDNAESEECTEDDVDDDVDDGDLYCHLYDNEKPSPLFEEASLKIDAMDFVHVSERFDEASAAGQVQCAVRDGKGHTEHDETLTEGVYRSTPSEAEETSLHIMTSMESLPRDEETGLANELVPVTWKVESATPGFDHPCHSPLITSPQQKDRSTEDSAIDVVLSDKLDMKLDKNLEKPDKSIKNATKGIMTDYGNQQDRNRIADSLTHEKRVESSDFLSAAKGSDNVEGHETNNENIQRKHTAWGRTEEELRDYVEEFQSLSTLNSANSFYKDCLSEDINCRIEKKCSLNEISSTKIEHETISETSGEDYNGLYLVEYLSKSIKSNEKTEPSMEASSNKGVDTNGTTTAESPSSVWGNSEVTQGIADGLSPDQISKLPKLPVKISVQIRGVEIWVDSGSAENDRPSASMPSQVVILEESLDTSQGSALESSSLENTSKLDLSKSISQISQFDMSKVEKSIFTGASVKTKIKNETVGSPHESSIRSSATGDKKTLDTISENIALVIKSSSLSDHSSLQSAGPHTARVKFALPSVSKQSHCRSRSLPRRRNASHSTLSRRSFSVSPSTLRKRDTKLQQESLQRLKRSVEIEGTPVCLILEKSGGEHDTSQRVSSIASHESCTYTCTSKSNKAMISTNSHIFSNSATNNCTLAATENFLTQQNEDKTSNDGDFGLDTKCTHSCCSIDSHTDYGDQKTMATTIGSFHSHCEEYAALTEEDQIIPFDTKTNIMDTSNVNMYGCKGKPIFKDNHLSEQFEESDAPVNQPQSFPPSNSCHSISSNSEVRVSLPNDDNSAWFAYRRQFREIFTPPQNQGYSNLPPTEASDFASYGREKKQSANVLATTVSPSDKNKRNYSELVSAKDVSPREAQAFPELGSSIYILSRPYLSIEQEDISIPKGENETWFAYRKRHRNLFTSDEGCNKGQHKMDHETANVTPELDDSKFAVLLPKCLTMPGNLVVGDQEKANSNNEIDTGLPRPLLPEKDLFGGQCSNQSNDTVSAQVVAESAQQGDTADVPSNGLLETAVTADATSSGMEGSQIERKKSSFPKDMPEKSIISYDPNLSQALKTIRADLPNQKDKELDTKWFRYRKTWSNLFLEGHQNYAKPTFKPYATNNPRFRRAMKKDEFDESLRRPTMVVSKENCTRPSLNMTDSKDGPPRDSSVVGDKSHPDVRFENFAVYKHSPRTCKKNVKPPKESVVGVVLQENFAFPASALSSSEKLSHVCDPSSKLNNGDMPPAKRRDRSLPRVRHTKRSLETNHPTSPCNTSSSPRHISSKQGTRRDEDHSDGPASMLNRRLVRLPEIQTALSLASGSRTSLVRTVCAEAAESTTSPERTRSPNARRQKRQRRESPSLAQAYVSRQQLPDWRSSDSAEKTQPVPPMAPIPETAGEGDLPDEASGGFEEGALLDKANLLFIRGVSLDGHSNDTEKQSVQLSQQMNGACQDNTTRLGGGDDVGPVMDAVGGLLQPPLDLTAPQPNTDIQVMAAQKHYDNANAFLRDTIPPKFKENKKMKTFVFKSNLSKFNNSNWDLLIDSRKKKVPSSGALSGHSSHSSVQNKTNLLDYKSSALGYIEQELIQTELAEMERQRKSHFLKGMVQKQSVSRLSIAPWISREEGLSAKSKVQGYFSSHGSTVFNPRFSIFEEADKTRSTETKAGGDKIRLPRGKRAGPPKGAPQDGKSPKKKTAVKQARRNSASSGMSSITSSNPQFTHSPARAVRQKGRAKLSPRRVLAEGHYHHDTNVVSVVVKPVNVKLDGEQVNLKVQVHRNPPKNKTEVLQPHPPEEVKPATTRPSCRKIRLRRPSPAKMPILASNIIDVRAVNPPFDTTNSPEAHRRFQSIYGHRKLM